MVPGRALVAFSSRSGSTAATAALIAAELRAAGLAVDLRPASEVESVEPYTAIVLGSGVFVSSRATDGSGLLARFATEIAPRPTWLFCVGPIGREPSPATCAGGAVRECGVYAVARAVGARGAAAFGTAGIEEDAAANPPLVPLDHSEVRAWARGIAADLAVRSQLPGRRHDRHKRHGRLVRTIRPGFAAAG